MNKITKTNAMRILDQKNIEYIFHDNTSFPSTVGTEVAEYMKVDPSYVFKTLVTVGLSKEHYVYMIPVAKELDLKKAAKAVGEKNVEMIKSKELLPLTGYIHGGCSPIGMKKEFSTFIDSSVNNIDTIYFSGGKIGYQLEMKVSDLKKAININICDLIKE